MMAILVNFFTHSINQTNILEILILAIMTGVHGVS
jgi:hypothetical protein